MISKQAFILFAKAPILGQVGNSLPGNFSDEQRLAIYTSYLKETINYFNSLENIDLILSCEENYQEVLLRNTFPELELIKTAGGDMGEKLEALAHHALSYLEYDHVFLALQEFTFIDEEILNRWGKTLNRISHSVILVAHETDLGLIGLNFPFTGIYEDIVWQKSDVIKQLQRNIKDLHIKSTLLKEDIFSAPENNAHYSHTTELLTSN